jgi:putative PIN family toxin of toxin-antitoxin system
MHGMVPRLVLDTNVVLDCFGFEDPESRTIVECLEARRALLLSCAPLRMELERVLRYPGLPFDAGVRSRVLARYDALAVTIDAPAPGFPVPRCRDEDDQKFLEAARDGAADFLITKDKALLRLARGKVPRGRFSIVTPSGFSARRVCGH